MPNAVILTAGTACLDLGWAYRVRKCYGSTAGFQRWPVEISFGLWSHNWDLKKASTGCWTLGTLTSLATAWKRVHCCSYIYIYIYASPPPQGPPFKIKSCVFLLLNKQYLLYKIVYIYILLFFHPPKHQIIWNSSLKVFTISLSKIIS